MKKLLLRFTLVFLAVLTISYAAAPFDSSNGEHEKTERSRTRNLTSPKIQALHTEGLARYIGVSNSYFKDKFGEPDEKIDSVEGVEWWNYDVNQNDYLRVGIDKYTKKVCDIIELSAKLKQQLSVGMSMDQVLKKTTLYANFAFDVNEQTAQIELSEYDLNNHPLVSFDNGSYAILDFMPGKRKAVYAIHYLDKNELLKGKYYKVAVEICQQN
ncbi:CAP-associated domain-containing protein [Ligilactobacillus sp.]|uniref:CAP-associated domain-containing protein n=1 Tax=Ligilactobacillus sp. TaxID=2767921 RepID=UPI002FE05A52